MAYRQKVYVLSWMYECFGDTDYGVYRVFSSEETAKETLKDLFYNKKEELADENDCDIDDIDGDINDTGRYAYISVDDKYYNWTIQEKLLDYSLPDNSTPF